MKKKYLIAEFIVIFIFLLIPPLLQGPINDGAIQIANGGRFSLQIFMQLAVSLALLIQDKKFPFKGFKEDERKSTLIIRFMTWWPICLGLTMITQAAVTGLSMLFQSQNQQAMIFPSTVPGWIVYFFNMTSAVIYEETVYRLFLPELLTNLSGDKKNLRLPLEIFSILIFAFSHRYLGLLAVLNAAICGGILRLTKIKSKKIWAGVLAHLLYNSFQTIFSIFL